MVIVAREQYVPKSAALVPGQPCLAKADHYQEQTEEQHQEMFCHLINPPIEDSKAL
jgi:hypothetical protein